MHPEEVVIRVTRSQADIDKAKKKYPKIKNLINLTYPYYHYDGGNLWYVRSGGAWTCKGNYPTLIYKGGRGTSKITFATGVAKTLAEEIQEFGDIADVAGDSSGRKIWKVTKADKWSVDDLRVGDVLVWYNPNRYTHTILELTALAVAEEGDVPGLAEKFNDPFHSDGSYICHYSIYFGKVGDTPMQLHCGSASGGIAITPIEEKNINPTPGFTGAILGHYYRFYDDGTMESNPELFESVTVEWLDEE
jgi:hypothetical protein